MEHYFRCIVTQTNNCGRLDRSLYFFYIFIGMPDFCRAGSKSIGDQFFLKLE